MRILKSLGKHVSEQPEAVLREQYATLKQQIPLMYALMFINVVYLSIITNRSEALGMSLGIPVALSAVLAIRTATWILRRSQQVSVSQIRTHLRGTIAVAAILSALFGGWAFMLFAENDPARSTSIALYIFVGSISCCYCLQAFPIAARLVLLFGALPVTVRLLISHDWHHVGIGLTFVLVAIVILRTIATNRSAMFEVLRSRSELSSLLTALQQSEEHYRHSVELNPQIPWISNPEGRILELSPRWSVLTGVPIEEALDWGWTARVHPDDLPDVIERWTATLKSNDRRSADTRYRLKCADEGYRWCRARANARLDDDGKVICWYGTLEDIHDQVTAELALRDSEERYRLASRATNDLIWDWSHATDQIHWADDIEEVLGYPEAARGTTIAWWVQQIHPEDRSAILANYARVLKNGEDNWSHEYRFRSGDGTYVNLFSRGYVVRDEDGVPLRSIGALLDVTLTKRVEADLRWAAYHDPLTRLPNRKLFEEKLETALAHAERDSTCVGVNVIDVDGFKLINDSLGHAAGDIVLKTVAARLLANMPEDATVARLGGDEFAVILPGLRLEDARASTVAKITKGVGDPMNVDDKMIQISISAGAAMWPKDGSTGEDVLKCADLALYAAKTEGSGTARGFKPSMRDAVELQKTMLLDAHEALQDDRIIPFYQPKIALDTGKVVGFEALLRWHHHRRGLQPPHAIKSAFEDSLLSPQLTDRIIDRVLTDMRMFADKGREFGRIAINASSRDFRRDDFADQILNKLRRAGLPPSMLELEVTETVFLEQIASNVERALRTLATEGVTIALDDFGTGYASLTHLQQFPVNVLKIDRSFVSRLDSADVADVAIVHGVIDIAHKINIATVAEGVETELQADQLRKLGCDVAQGFLYSRAISADRVAPWMAAWSQNDPAAAGQSAYLRTSSE